MPLIEDRSSKVNPGWIWNKTGQFTRSTLIAPSIHRVCTILRRGRTNNRRDCQMVVRTFERLPQRNHARERQILLFHGIVNSQQRVLMPVPSRRGTHEISALRPSHLTRFTSRHYSSSCVFVFLLRNRWPVGVQKRSALKLTAYITIVSYRRKKRRSFDGTLRMASIMFSVQGYPCLCSLRHNEKSRGVKLNIWYKEKVG